MTLSYPSSEHTYTHMIDRIMPPNLEGIRMSLPHRLYADRYGSWMEIQTQYVSNFHGEKSDVSGIILGITRSWQGGKKTETFFIDELGIVFAFDLYGGMHKAFFDVSILYMLLNPLEELDGWRLNDVIEAKKHQSVDTYSMIGLRSEWGYTETFHPELEAMMEHVRAQIKSRF